MLIRFSEGCGRNATPFRDAHLTHIVGAADVKARGGSVHSIVNDVSVDFVTSTSVGRDGKMSVARISVLRANLTTFKLDRETEVDVARERENRKIQLENRIKT